MRKNPLLAALFEARNAPSAVATLKSRIRLGALAPFLLGALALPVTAERFEQPQNPAQTQPSPPETQTTTLPPQSQAQQGAMPLRVMVGKSLLINTTGERLRRIS